MRCQLQGTQRHALDAISDPVSRYLFRTSLIKMSWPHPVKTQNTVLVQIGSKVQYVYSGFQLGVDTLILLILPREVTGSEIVGLFC